MMLNATHALTALALVLLGVAVEARDLHWLGEPDMPAEFFPIMPWDSPQGLLTGSGDRKADLEGIAECGFTVAGFVEPQDLAACERLGLKAIIRGPRDRAPWRDRWQGVSDEVIDGEIKRLVGESGKSPAVIGYYIVDEPGTPRFAALGKAVAAVRKYAPGKLAYINLFPGYATIGAPDQSQLGAASFTEYLEKFVADVKPQMLSYDDYMVTYSDNFQDAKRAAVYFRDLLEVRRVALKHGIPFWNTVCSNRIRPFTTVPSPANLLLQAYTTLAAGGRGIAWYTYHQRGYAYAPIDASGKRTDTWQYLQMVNRQVRVIGPVVNRLKSTGVFFTDPPAEGMAKLPGRIVEAVESRASIKGLSDAKPPIMVGEFEGEDGHDYVMLVNLSLEKSANVTLRTVKKAASKEVISAQDGSASPIDEENGQWLVPGGGVLIRLLR